MTEQNSVQPLPHEEPHFDPDTGACLCECARCADSANDVCRCPECPGGCDMEHALPRAERLRAQADALLAQADALVRASSSGGGGTSPSSLDPKHD